MSEVRRDSPDEPRRDAPGSGGSGQGWPGGYGPGGYLPPGGYPPGGYGSGGYPPGGYPPGGYGPGGPQQGGPGGFGGPGRSRGGPPGGGQAWWQRPSSLVLIAVAVFVAIVVLRSGVLNINKFTVIYFCVLIPSIILHEISHGAVAYAFGDDTAKRAGRLTLNPLAHIDPVGTIILPAILVLTSGVAFGWAKPVPVNVSRLRHRRNASVLVSLAGPATNAAIFLVAAVVFRVLAAHDAFVTASDPSPLIYDVLYLAGLANIWVGLFNLLPVPPLDGSAVLERVLPDHALPTYFRLRPFGMVAVLLIVLTFFRNPAVSNHIGNFAYDIFKAVAGPGPRL